ncbi:glycine betaine ABC transporter substrate-binding protein [Caulobacter sp. 1776]|uniref:glycine betaine ABC transporter substrate-binding protein n=1 Tax=Caulobacter sp. 1776 TaxID=3156420 RepID=UPI0033962821
MSQEIAGAGVDGRDVLVLGQINIGFHDVVGAVVQEALARLGHRVRVIADDSEAIFRRLEEGAIDLMVTAWLPEANATQWARYGPAAEVVTILYRDARFFWASPDYIPETEVSSIADLARPSVAARMTKLIQGGAPMAAINAMSQRAIIAYGLDRLGYMLRAGSQADWIAAFDVAAAERRWFVFPCWTPQYLNRDGRLRPLSDPQRILGSLNDAVLAAPRGRLAAIAPRTRQALERMTIGLEGVIEMDRLVSLDGRTPRQAARAWMSANSRRVETWLKP